MFKRLLSVGGFTLLSRITGFARDVLLAWTLGAGLLSDAFFVAFLFPNYFRAIFGEGTINPAFLPRYAALQAKGEHDGRGAIRRSASSPGRWRRRWCCWCWRLVFMPLIIHVLAPGWSRRAIRADRQSWRASPFPI